MKTPDGRLLWVGKNHGSVPDEEEGIHCYEIHNNHTFTKISTEVHASDYENTFCEPHCLALDEKHFLCLIRVQGDCFTVYQSESHDGGISWSDPVNLGVDGSPPHLLSCSNGLLVSAYGKRTEPFGISAMVSDDSGKSWHTELPLVRDCPDPDLGYPCSVELDDSSIFTVYYAKPAPGEVPGIQYVRWSIT